MSWNPALARASTSFVLLCTLILALPGCGNETTDARGVLEQWLTANVRGDHKTALDLTSEKMFKKIAAAQKIPVDKVKALMVKMAPKLMPQKLLSFEIGAAEKAQDGRFSFVVTSVVKDRPDAKERPAKERMYVVREGNNWRVAVSATKILK